MPNKATSYFISSVGCIHLGDMSGWAIPEGFSYLRLFYNDYYLETIEGYPPLVADGINTNDINSSCFSLRHIKKSGKISRSVSFLYCYLLTRESILVLFNALDPDNAGTITLSAPSKGKLTDADKAIATNKGWTIA